MTDTTDIETLEHLLDGLIAAPVERVLAEQLGKTEVQFKRLGQVLRDIDLSVSDMNEAAEKRQKASDQLTKDVAVKLDTMIGRIVALAGEQQVLRSEWQDAHTAAAQESKQRNEASVLSRRRQLHRLALIAPGAGLLSAAAVELIHHLL